jgi:transposase-like protein
VLETFVKWLLSTGSQSNLPVIARTWREQTVWCWHVDVPMPLTGEVHFCLIIDGIKVGNAVCLVVRNVDYVVAWQWVPYESTAYWSGLLQMLPAPHYVVCDGQKGMLRAIATVWPDTTIQRCRFHVWMRVKKHLGLNPRLVAGQELLQLGKDVLCTVNTQYQARDWKYRLQAWHTRHDAIINERVAVTDPKLYAKKWRYAHKSLRNTYALLHDHVDDILQSSFHPNPKLPSTTNHIEGGINSQIRTLLKTHRGMPRHHQQKLVEWYLYSRTEAPKPPRFCL